MALVQIECTCCTIERSFRLHEDALAFADSSLRCSKLFERPRPIGSWQSAITTRAQAVIVCWDKDTERYEAQAQTAPRLLFSMDFELSVHTLGKIGAVRYPSGVGDCRSTKPDEVQ